jgi:hypothetical protein
MVIYNPLYALAVAEKVDGRAIELFDSYVFAEYPLNVVVCISTKDIL